VVVSALAVALALAARVVERSGLAVLATVVCAALVVVCLAAVLDSAAL